ncbi:MAG: hypothetical protein EI684_04635, partial [Candidatus Viridilinea halotolerans]
MVPAHTLFVGPIWYTRFATSARREGSPTMFLLRPLARLWLGGLAATALAFTLLLAVRALAPFAPWHASPALFASDPLPHTIDRPPRSTLTLTFTQPMNPASVRAALRLDPPTPGHFVWSADATTLTFRPTLTFTPASTYTLRLDTQAQSRWWQPLAQPFTLTFTTAAQPALIAALPAGTAVPATSPLALVFSQPMVPAASLGQPVTLPELGSHPPLDLQGQWLDQQTLLLTSATPLAPATRYTFNLAAQLSDQRGVTLGSNLRWSFSTAWPELYAFAPPDQARGVSPREPLRLHFAAPLDEALLRQTIQFTPTITGTWQSATDTNGYHVTFTPEAGWAYGVTYEIALVAPANDAHTPPLAAWRFSVAPQPRLVALFPGQGQLLAPGDPIRLIFSTPMDEASLRTGLRFDPPVPNFDLSLNESEVRLLAPLQASTLYTLTLAATTRDRAGEPLGSEALVRLRTAAARPALHAPNAFANIRQLSPVAPSSLTLEVTNLAALDLSIYPLDEATLLRLLALRRDEWPAFNPTRYGQSLARQWRVIPGSSLNASERLSVPLSLSASAALPAGAYFLRITSPEGPRSDLLLLVSDLRLTLQHHADHALVWATDSSGQPRANLPVALYQGATLLGSGQTDAEGLWRFPAEEGGGAESGRTEEQGTEEQGTEEQGTEEQGT